ncbi:PIN domain-containing protein [Palleronia abyssalis]|uniref:PIN domain-containing protein n=1 Tax=Palleronia abyssalis TaxID=1501240 RepID=UPI001FE48432|nr:type II toxin-antitoxin system VapC family toxin [Palleronia abyssalis]
MLVRFLVEDDPDQGRAARALFDRLTEADPGFLSREVMIETVWVLERAYRFDRAQISGALSGLLDAAELVIEAGEDIALALERYRKGGPGMADHMIRIAADRAGCDTVYTFDRKAAAQGDMTLLT